jgi:hypothetical protein
MSIFLLLAFIFLFASSEANVSHKKIGETWDHGELFKPSNREFKPKFVSDAEVHMDNLHEKANDDKTLRQHSANKRSISTSAIRIGSDRLRNMTITVRQTLRIL